MYENGFGHIDSYYVWNKRIAGFPWSSYKNYKE